MAEKDIRAGALGGTLLAPEDKGATHALRRPSGSSLADNLAVYGDAAVLIAPDLLDAVAAFVKER